MFEVVARSLHSYCAAQNTLEGFMRKRRKRRAHGGGQVVPPKLPGGTWGIRWREAGQRRFKGGYQTRELAERVLAKVTGDVAVGHAGLPRDPKNVQALGQL